MRRHGPVPQAAAGRDRHPGRRADPGGGGDGDRARAAELERSLSAETPTPPRTLAELFLGFLDIGTRSFGGVMPFAYRVMVEERRWLSKADFTETIGLCQFLPGPNIGNATIVLGKRWFGVRGAVTAFAGLMAMPFVVYLALAMVYTGFSGNPTVRGAVAGIGAVGAGLYIGTAAKLAAPLARSPAGFAIALGCFVAVAFARLSLLAVLPVAAAAALFLAFRGKL